MLIQERPSVEATKPAADRLDDGAVPRQQGHRQGEGGDGVDQEQGAVRRNNR